MRRASSMCAVLLVVLVVLGTRPFNGPAVAQEPPLDASAPTEPAAVPEVAAPTIAPTELVAPDPLPPEELPTEEPTVVSAPTEPRARVDEVPSAPTLVPSTPEPTPTAEPDADFSAAAEGTDTVDVREQDEAGNPLPSESLCFTVYYRGSGGVRGSGTRKGACGDFADGIDDGKVRISGLAAGQYLLGTERVPLGYKLAADVPFDIGFGGRVLSLTISYPLAPVVRVVAVPPPGASFAPYSCAYLRYHREHGQSGPATDQLCEAPDASTGEVTFVFLGVAPGDYTYEEIRVPNGIATTAPVPFTMGDADVLLTVPHQMGGALTVSVLDRGQQSIPRDVCATARVAGSSPISQQWSACTGIGSGGTTPGSVTITSLPPGSYEVQGHIPESSGGTRFESFSGLTAAVLAGETASVSAVLRAYPVIEVRSTRANGQLWSGACYVVGHRTVCDDADKIGDGIVTLSNLDPGTYTIRVQSPPSGLVGRAADTQEVTVGIGDRATPTFVFDAPPTASVKTAVLVVGSTLVANAAGFEPGTSAEVRLVYFGGVQTYAGAVPVDTQGRATLIYVLGNLPGGAYRVRFTGPGIGRTAEAAFSVGQRLYADAKSAPANTNVTFTLNGFYSSELVDLVLVAGAERQALGNLRTDLVGTGFLVARVPAGASGAFSVQAVARTDSTRRAEVPLTRLASGPLLVLSKASGTVNSTLTLDLWGFKAHESVTVRWYNGSTATTLASVTAGSDGRATVAVRVPAAAGGAHTVEAKGGLGTKATASFRVSPRAAAAPGSGRVGSRVTVSLSGYAAGARVEIRFSRGGTPYKVLATVTTTATGSATATITVPAHYKADDYRVVAKETATTTVAEGKFTVTP